MSNKTMALKPVMSEKTYAESQSRNVYVFNVPGNANKLTVAGAVEAQFNVSVEAVNILNRKGKAKRTVRKGGRPITGRQSDVKKAYVTVKRGDSIPVFAAVEEAEKEASPAKLSKKVSDAKKAESKAAKKEKK